MSSETHDQRPGELRIIGKEYIERWISALIVLLILLAMGNPMLNDPRFEWPVIAENFTGPSIIQGVLMTLQLTIVSVIFDFAGSAILALMRLSSNPVLVAVSWGYTQFFRGVSILVQLFLWYNIVALYPTISISLPWIGEIWSASANSLISPFSAAVIALVMHQSAYAAEIIRAGTRSASTGRVKTARALGRRPTQIFLHTILPQVMRTTLPPAGNKVIGQLKTTVVVSVISLQDVLSSAQIIYQRTYGVVPLLLVATLQYLLLTSLLSVIQYYVERHFSRSSHRKVERKAGKASASGAVSTPSIGVGEASHG